MQSRPTVGSQVQVQAIKEIGVIVTDACDHVPYQIRGFDGELLLSGMFFRERDVVNMQPHVCARPLVDPHLRARISSPSHNSDSARLQQRNTSQEQLPNAAHTDCQVQGEQVISAEPKAEHIQPGSSNEDTHDTIRTPHTSGRIDREAVSYLGGCAKKERKTWAVFYALQNIASAMHLRGVVQKLIALLWNLQPDDKHQQQLFVSAVGHHMLTLARCDIDPMQKGLHKMHFWIKYRLSVAWALAVQTLSAGSWPAKLVKVFMGIGLGLSLVQSTKFKGWRA